MDNCTQTTNFCLSCNGQGRWKGYNNAMFPQDPTKYKQPVQQVIGGINNSKNFRTSASSFTILKKSLITVSTVSLKPTFGKDVKTGTPLTSYTNVGGPGDATASVPIRTGTASGIKARTIVQPHQTGVDVKHGSYERYLARKRGNNMRCRDC
tara:strand:- start:1043 stop:1498 length:456 start_codon:yes stop_codon:yes gene_type:complete